MALVLDLCAMCNMALATSFATTNQLTLSTFRMSKGG